MTEVKAANGSALSRLRDRRKAAVDALHLDVAVPRLDPPVFVRFRPVVQADAEAVERRFRGSKDKDKNVIRHAASLAEFCVGIFEKDAAGNEVGIDSDAPADWPKFDHRLAALLEVEASAAVDVVRELYLTDGDIISTSLRLAEWSGYAGLDDEDDAGN